MPLESCMIVIDNSEYTRNGDYTPTRFQAQAQAVASVFTAKTDSNPESSVGLLSMAGKSPSLLVTPTNDIGKLLQALSRAQIGGTADLTTAVQIAQLALKHRENKNARQRVVVFAGSHIEEAEEDLIKLGKKLRKNNVLIDVCLFGEEGMEGEEKIGKLIEAAGGGECHLVVIPPGPHLLSDLIQTSPILYDGERVIQPNGDGGEGGGDMDGGIDPNMDPELAMAIRMSLQDAAEAAARESASSAAASSSSASAPAPISDPTPSSSTAAPILPASVTAPISNANEPKSMSSAPGDIVKSTTTEIGGDAEMEDEEEDEEEMMKRAMALSRGDDVDMDSGGGGGDDDEEEEDEDAAMAKAIAMSMEDAKGDKK